MAKDVRQRATNESLTDAMRTLLERTSYHEEITRLYEKPEERQARQASLEELTNAVNAYEENDHKKEPDLTGFLSEIALSGREMGNEKDKLAAQNAVWLLTLHAAKGTGISRRLHGWNGGRAAAPQPQRQIG